MQDNQAQRGYTHHLCQSQTQAASGLIKLVLGDCIYGTNSRYWSSSRKENRDLADIHLRNRTFQICRDPGKERPNEEIGKHHRPKATKEEKRRFYGMLEYQRRLKGYQPGWMAHKYQERFGVWPKGFRDQGPIKPDAAFKNYMTHLAIKWAKSPENPKNRVAA